MTHPSPHRPADGCTSVHCFCKEFLLPEGDYQNPFDSTHTTGIRCDYSQAGWYGGMINCIGGFFDPLKRTCVGNTDVTRLAMSKQPYRRASVRQLPSSPQLACLSYPARCSNVHVGYDAEPVCGSGVEWMGSFHD
jgi:hypothetical protein